MDTINLRPTWKSLLPALIEVFNKAEHKNTRGYAMDELRRMADVADRYVAEQEQAYKIEQLCCNEPTNKYQVTASLEIGGTIIVEARSAEDADRLVKDMIEQDELNWLGDDTFDCVHRDYNTLGVRKE